MLQKLLAHSPDLQKLVAEGYELEVRGPFALVHHVPYVNEQKEIKYGVLVSSLTLSGNATKKPDTHVIHFIGDQPCDKEGKQITALLHAQQNRNLGQNIYINRSFSNKPTAGYLNYYDKFVQYIKIISGPALSMDKHVTAQTYRTINEKASTVFQYEDSNSSRATIGAISEKVSGQKIGIIGLGGSGSYVLDLISKSPVQSINLYDGDKFFQHNAFRSPGAPALEEIEKCESKVKYFANIYSHMHKHIFPHDYYIDEENVESLQELDFVFLCIDRGNVKKIITRFLVDNKIPFIDVGMGIINEADALLGQVRIAFVSEEKKKGISYIDMAEEDEVEDVYRSNIQIAELNAMNACMAVIRWKKHVGYYQDVRNYCVDVYSINDGELNHEENEEI